MKPIQYHSTNNPSHKVSFETALLRGLAPDYGLYTIPRTDIPRLSPQLIRGMREMSMPEIAFEVLNPSIGAEIPKKKLEALLQDAYSEDKIPTRMEKVIDNLYIMWLTDGPTYSFKDYAARFYARALNYFLEKRKQKRVVIVATSGDTGGAIADALYGLDNVINIVFYPKGSISEGQRRQMTTLEGNVYAFEVNGDFNVCQALAKYLLGNKKFAQEVFGDPDRFTSANSISVGRLLPQAVYPFFAYSRLPADGKPMIASIPSGNLGDMMGTVIAWQMGLPIAKIVCGVNENKEFPEFLRTGKYKVSKTAESPSSAMNVNHPSNLARLFDIFGGHMFDERDSVTKKVIKEGVIKVPPDRNAMNRDIFSVSIDDEQHYKTMKEVYDKYGTILDPHGAVGWRALEIFLAHEQSLRDNPAVIYETADPGKFPDDVKKALGITPVLPPEMQAQANKQERIYSVNSEPTHIKEGTKERLELSDAQVEEAKQEIKKIFKK